MRYMYKWIHFLKELSWWLIIFLLGFLCGMKIMSVKAYVDPTDKNLNYVFNSNLENYKGVSRIDEVEEIVELVKQIGKHYIITATTQLNSSGIKTFHTMRIYLFDTDKVNLTAGGYTSTSYGYSIFVDNAYFFHSGLTETSGINTSFEILIDALKNDTYTLKGYSNPNLIIYNATQQGNTFYYDNIYATDLILTNSSQKTYNMNSIEVAPGDTFPNMEDFVTYTPKTYTENLRIDAKGIDRIEYTFKFDNENTTHEFNFSTTWYSSIARLDLFSPPHLEYKKNNTSYKLPLDEHRQTTLDEIVYYDTQINPFKEIQELKFIVNFSNINDLTNESNVFIHFDSSLDFTKKIIYTSDPDSSTNYYTEINFSEKYGVYLIPKLVQNEIDNEVYSNILYHGKDIRIDIFASTNTSNPPVETRHDYNNVGKIWGNFNYLFRYNNKNQMLFFINQNYLTDTEPTKIKYDTRYFSHSICDTEFKCDPINNPNTGEEINPKPPTDEESYNFNSTIKKIKDFIVSLHTNLDPIAESIQYFFDSLPPIIKNFLIAIYSCFLLFGLYRVIRR